jgi:hypothetical protein
MVGTAEHAPRPMETPGPPLPPYGLINDADASSSLSCFWLALG